MKNFASFLIGLALAGFASSCNAPNDQPPLSSSAYDYFYQNDETQIYTYSQDNASQTDTVAYLVRPVDNSQGSYFKLQQENSSSTTNGVLYYFKNKISYDGSKVCVLSNSSTGNGFVALQGTMDLGQTWYADSAQNIQAVVVGKYAQYYLPGREVHYDDVVVVKYTDKTAPSGNYTVRYFARYYGLISELSITGSNTQVTDLQLLSRQGTSGANVDPHHDRWYNANGRSVANLKHDDGLDK